MKTGIRIQITDLDGELLGSETLTTDCYADYREMVREARSKAASLAVIELASLLIRSGVPPAEVL